MAKQDGNKTRLTKEVIEEVQNAHIQKQNVEVVTGTGVVHTVQITPQLERDSGRTKAINVKIHKG